MYIKLLTFIFIGFALSTNAQKFSNSPFSSYGIGEFGGLDNAIFSGMGNTSVSNLDSTILDVNNPSSYASLAHGQPLFSTGISSRFSEFRSGDALSNSKYIGIEQFALAIPFAKKLRKIAKIWLDQNPDYLDKEPEIEKELCEFNKHKLSKDGHKPSCRECQKIDSKIYKSKNKEKIKEQSKEYYINNKEKIVKKKKEY